MVMTAAAVQRGVDTKVIHLAPEEDAYLRKVRKDLNTEEDQATMSDALGEVCRVYKAHHRGKQPGVPGSPNKPTIHGTPEAYDILLGIVENIARTERRRRVSMGEAIRAACRFHAEHPEHHPEKHGGA
jgi:hypothetical protein